VYRKFEAIDFRLGDNSRAAGMLVATAFFLLAGFYGWAVFELPGRSPVGMPSATLLMPALAGLFGIANLIDIYVTTSEMPPQEQNWDLPPVKPLIVPCLLSSCCAAVMAILPGMTAAQATVVVMSARNFWGRLTDPDYIPADFEYGPGGINDPAARARIAEYRAETARLHGLDDSKFIDVAAPMIVDEAQATAVIEPSSDTEDSVDSSDDWDSVVGGEVTTIGDDHTELVERTEEDDAMLAKALEVKESSPELDDLDAQTRQQDLEVIAVLSATNTAVTVMVLTFLYLVLRPRSGAALALNMMYPIDQWTGLEPPSDYIRLMAITIGAGLFAVPVMIKVGQGMLKLHELIPLRSMVMGVVGFVTLLVWLSTGWIGIGVLIVGTAMGLMPPRIGIRRSHGMGIILVPIMIYTFAQKLDGFGFI
jgi:TctA family transporter